MKDDNVCIIPAENAKYCTVKQACEYLAFSKDPLPIQLDQRIRKALRKSPDIPPNALRVLLLKKGEVEYDKPIKHVSRKLYDMLKNGVVCAIDYDESPVAPNFWEHIRPEDITEDDGLFRFAKIDFDQLKVAMPVKQYTVELKDNGWLCINDGDTSTKLYKSYPQHKAYEWLNFYFTNPNQNISKQDVIDNFENSYYRFSPNDKISQCVYAAFNGKPHLMHLCFPIISNKAIYCSPTFNSTDAILL